MKKLLLILILLLALCGCKEKPIEVIEEPEPNNDPPISDVYPDYSDLQPIIDDVLEYLKGDWLLRSDNEDSNMSVTLTFDPGTNTLKILRSDDEYIIGELEPFNSAYDDAGINDAIEFKFKEASDYFISKYGNSEYMYNSYLQFFFGYFENNDYLFLRELGNGFSVTDMEGLGEDSMSGDCGWMFTRLTGLTYPTFTVNEEIKYKDDTFYALCWGRGETYLLQKVNVTEQEESWYEDPIKTLRVVYDGSENQYNAFLYNGKNLPDEVKPGLVLVTVDADGKVTDLKDIPYLGYGAYQGE